ncbi:MAG: zinc-containing alcohol dehydrogenase superfamily protein, partial [Devosia sp.]|uniref:alcohol dehydrogenase catalytic domain-containing protein n=1 Tax=Devosia sp. TaxID=1871048 RepID=UPI0026374F32
MKAMICREWGPQGVLTLADLPRQPLGAGQVRVRLRAVGINFADTLQIAGRHQVKPPLPFTPGMEMSGEILEIGRQLGARAIAAAGGAEKCALTLQYGADHAIDTRRESIRDRVRELTGGAGADV